MNSTPMMETQYTSNGNKSNITMAALTPCQDMACILYVLANMLIFILGIAGNGLVIWIAGFKIKSTNATWYLSLALSDVIFCCTLPIGIVQVVTDDWIFGLFMCKFMFFNMFFNWFSSIFLLVIISVDRCLITMFPVRAQNHRTVGKARIIVCLTWLVSAICCMPSAFYLDVEYDEKDNRSFCFQNYQNDQQEVADVVCRFIFGFVIPFLIIILCYVIIIRKLKTNQMTKKSNKPMKIMTVLIAAFLVCWLPFHTFALMRLDYDKYSLSFLRSGYKIGIILANANSCINPFLYTFMGKDFKKQCHAVLSKIENAIREDEGQHRLSTGTTVNSSGDRSLSTSL
ncbi:chemerin-like receptor 1 [Salminus brasiliensis]|uniref:chemerin-like receptor 1 n=1 Tax=Salminus brasiliensis TaxID=930266 RepID=UPI003B82D173